MCMGWECRPQGHCQRVLGPQVSIAVGLAAFACVLLVVLFVMINKYGRRSKFGMKGKAEFAVPGSVGGGHQGCSLGLFSTSSPLTCCRGGSGVMHTPIIILGASGVKVALLTVRLGLEEIHGTELEEASARSDLFPSLWVGCSTLPVQGGDVSQRLGLVHPKVSPSLPLEGPC